MKWKRNGKGYDKDVCRGVGENNCSIGWIGLKLKSGGRGEKEQKGQRRI